MPPNDILAFSLELILVQDKLKALRLRQLNKFPIVRESKIVELVFLSFRYRLIRFLRFNNPFNLINL